jgi:hypothetical protein
MEVERPTNAAYGGEQENENEGQQYRRLAITDVTGKNVVIPIQ